MTRFRSLRHGLLSALAALPLLFAASCGGGSDAKTGPVVLASGKSRITSPGAPPADLAAAVAGNNAFALDLYRRVIPGTENVLFSPHSISIALAMTYAGARGNTEKQMADVLHFPLPQDRLHAAFNALDLALSGRGQDARGKDGQPFRLAIANSLWGQAEYPFLESFLDVLGLNYGAGLRLADFAGNPDAAVAAINAWVGENTAQRIPRLLQPGDLDEFTRLVLCNAVYFNAAWARPFEKSATSDGPFRLRDGTVASVPMMRQSRMFPYGEGTDYQAVELPYDGEEIAMWILAPREGALDAFEAGLTPGRLDAIRSAMVSREVHLAMPRFDYRVRSPLADHLRALGMTDAFAGGVADLSGMDGTLDLVISRVIHEAFIGVDEAGTEAAAATAVIVDLTSAPLDPAVLTLDRPFLYLIRDTETGAILFLGRVADPR